eukprot:1551326-Pleurochrysis_carterae.AAC.1
MRGDDDDHDDDDDDDHDDDDDDDDCADNDNADDANSGGDGGDDADCGDHGDCDGDDDDDDDVRRRRRPCVTRVRRPSVRRRRRMRGRGSCSSSWRRSARLGEPSTRRRAGRASLSLPLTFSLALSLSRAPSLSLIVTPDDVYTSLPPVSLTPLSDFEDLPRCIPPEEIEGMRASSTRVFTQAAELSTTLEVEIENLKTQIAETMSAQHDEQASIASLRLRLV